MDGWTDGRLCARADGRMDGDARADGNDTISRTCQTTRHNHESDKNMRNTWENKDKEQMK